jgi:hypothetical protein
MINVRSEPIVAVGAIISGIPLVDRVPEEVLGWESGTCVTVDADRAVVVVNDRLRDEKLKSALFEKCKEDLSLTEEDLEELERSREQAWSETRKKYSL